MKVLGLIPARGGSKGIPNKNILPLAGKSLVERAFETAKSAGVLDRIIVSTDDQRIAQLAEGIGLEVPFIRPPVLAGDGAAMIDVVVHALEFLRSQNYAPDAVLLLQPTSPFRRAEHIQQALSLLEDFDAVCSVVPLPKDICPHYLMKVSNDGMLEYFLPDGPSYVCRQDVPQAYQRDGIIYLTRTPILIEQRSFYGKRCVPMVIEPSESLNIDEPDDWIEAERRLAQAALKEQNPETLS